ncbi:VWA domain-containing protein [Roseiconus nitratireducens]|uniref:VWA domain-containing protein n=1 Tax=Roseiconus nitratireducens TaxID=2605748 RepID=A0A5M6CV85_9BACT|nr:vWA domain-containing protein [Roseiconus nitratireducens]KAA5539168.1 VWA domain-containing protein [Roseiconus nitratireducens]
MQTDFTDITLVIDRSGSMASMKKDAEGGINSFIASQAAEPGRAVLTLVQFDTDYEFVHSGVPIGDVPPYELHPRGCTALLDAVGRAINETGERLAKMQEADRPGLVIFVVMTDGLENSSHEFSKQQIKKMIEHQQDIYSWHFTFLGANQDAFAEAGGVGIHASGTANFDGQRVLHAMVATGAKVKRMRGQALEGLNVDNAFTDEERRQMK